MRTKLGGVFILGALAGFASAAHAEPWGVSTRTIQEGYYRDKGECRDFDSDEIDGCGCEALIVVPELKNLGDAAMERKLNAHLASGGETCRGKKVPAPKKKKDVTSYKRQYEVSFQNEQLIAIKEIFHTYNPSALHGMHSVWHIIIDKETGEPLRPEMAFDEEALKEANLAIDAELKKSEASEILFEESTYPRRNYVGEGANAVLYPDASGKWRAFFNVYVVAPYVAGAIDVPFTRPDLFNDPRLKNLGGE